MIAARPRGGASRSPLLDGRPPGSTHCSGRQSPGRRAQCIGRGRVERRLPALDAAFRRRLDVHARALDADDGDGSVRADEAKRGCGVGGRAISCRAASAAVPARFAASARVSGRVAAARSSSLPARRRARSNASAPLRRRRARRASGASPPRADGCRRRPSASTSDPDRRRSPRSPPSAACSSRPRRRAPRRRNVNARARCGTARGWAATTRAECRPCRASR